MLGEPSEWRRQELGLPIRGAMGFGPTASGPTGLGVASADGRSGVANGLAALLAIELPSEHLLSQVFRSGVHAERILDALRTALRGAPKDWRIGQRHVVETDVLVVELPNASVAFNYVAPTLAGLVEEFGENGRLLQAGLIVGARATDGTIVPDDIAKARELCERAAPGMLMLTESALNASGEPQELFTPIGLARRFRERLYFYRHRFRARSGNEATLETIELLNEPLSRLNLTPGLASRLSSAGIERIGDLATAFEGELLRVPGVGVTALTKIKRSLWHAGGLEVGMGFPDWRRHGAPEADLEDIAQRIAAIGQHPLGARFEETEDALHIAEYLDEADEAAARQPITQQLHADGLRKLQALAIQVARLDNQPGWEGVGALTRRFAALLDRPVTDIPQVIGAIYSAALELGSFLEFDDALAAGRYSGADQLSPELRRSLEDCVRTLAPWVRRFPSAQELDDEAGQFLVRTGQVSSARNAVAKARAAHLIDAADSGAIEGLLSAGNRGDRVGHKAAARGVATGRNLVLVTLSIVAVGTLTFLKDAVSSDYATRSVLVKRAGAFLAAAEAEALALVEDLPTDLRLAFRSLLAKEHSGHSDMPE